MRNPNRNPSNDQSSSSSLSTKNISTASDPTDRIDDNRVFLSPGFKSVAAMAGWDEEAILLATLIVEDTPERLREQQGAKQEKKKKRAESQFKTPPTNSRRKRKAQRRSLASIPAVVLNLEDEGDTSNTGRDVEKDKEETETDEISSGQQERNQLGIHRSSASSSSSCTTTTSATVPDTDKREPETNEKIDLKQKEKDDELGAQGVSVASSSSSSFAATSQALTDKDNKGMKTSEIRLEKAETKEEEKHDELGGQGSSAPSSNLPDMEKLREELSCAICLEICFEPSTTPCGHSFCKKCLRSAADKCGKRCPKCRQLISNGRSCTVNTVLWNTIQLLFPSEIEVRKAAGAALDGKSVTEQQSTRRTEGRERRLSIQHRRHRHRGSSILPQRPSSSSSSSSNNNQVVVMIPSQNEDAALALRLQREEFVRAYGPSSTTTRRSAVAGGSGREYERSNALAARANLRAMATRAISLRSRNPPN